jgi:DNA-binding NtrC family response regulator
MEWVDLIPESQKERLAAAARDSRQSVLISGAPGTGKGQIARWIHLNGPRAKGSMLIAHHRKPLAEQLREAGAPHAVASNDTALILQELGEWPLGDQRVLVEHITAVHAGKPGARIIATTDQNLEKRAQGGLFKPELLALFQKLRIEMPSLASRTSEFETITNTLLAELARELKRPVPALDDAAWKKLKNYDWPGNLRELRNVLKLALGTCPGTLLGVKEFPEFGYDRTDFHATRDAFEKTYLEEMMRAFAGNRTQLAAATGLAPTALEAKLKKHGLV